MNRKKLKFRMGIILISVSVFIFLLIFALPFLSIGPKVIIALTSVFIVAGELLFWGGVLLIGKEVYLKFKAKLMSGGWMGNKGKDEKDIVS
jgi:hypothetical protein